MKWSFILVRCVLDLIVPLKVKRVTESEIQELRSRGYDEVSLHEAMAAFLRCQLADKLIEQIAVAFSGVVLGEGIGLQQAQGLDDYEDEARCAAYRERDEKLDWGKISSIDLNRCHSSLSFFDPEGMRFHLPAYLRAELLDEYGFGMAFPLTQVGDFERYYSALNSSQRQAVRQFLLLIRDDPDYEFDRPHIERALTDYWI